MASVLMKYGIYNDRPASLCCDALKLSTFNGRTQHGALLGALQWAGIRSHELGVEPMFAVPGTMSVVVGPLYDKEETMFTLVGCLFAEGKTLFAVVGSLFGDRETLFAVVGNLFG